MNYSTPTHRILFYFLLIKRIIQHLWLRVLKMHSKLSVQKFRNESNLAAFFSQNLWALV